MKERFVTIYDTFTVVKPLSLHLKQGEKKHIINAINLDGNQEDMKRLKELIK